jgi:hypothetical protein
MGYDALKVMLYDSLSLICSCCYCYLNGVRNSFLEPNALSFVGILRLLYTFSVVKFKVAANPKNAKNAQSPTNHHRLVAVAQTVPTSDSSDTSTAISIHDIPSSSLPPGTSLADAVADCHTTRRTQTRDMARVTHMSLCLAIRHSKDITRGSRCVSRPTRARRRLRPRLLHR